LKYRKLGKTKLTVSEVGLGCWELGGKTTINGIPLTYGHVDENTASKIIKTAIKIGINTFDTADSYSLGNSEKRLGNEIKKMKNRPIIFTKGGIIPAQNVPLPVDVDLSYEYLISSIKRSLDRLKITKIDLFQAHKPPKNEKELNELGRVFKKIKEEGLASFCGISIGLEYELGKKLIDSGIIDTLQLYFSLIDFKPSLELLSYAKKNNIGIIISEPLGQGFLSGKYKKDHKFGKNDIRRISYSANIIKEKIEKAHQFKFLKTENRNIAQIAIAYILSHKEVSLCIPGTSSIEHVILNSKASEVKLTNDELKQIKEIQDKWDN
jgi:aryl-alcohol dehydrogenase-like predicted oxidoreductase